MSIKSNIVTFSDIVEENGKTVRENNIALKHKYPIGQLVEFEVDEIHGKGTFIKGKVRAYVCRHTRDCDGSPLYEMCLWDPKSWKNIDPRLTPKNYEYAVKTTKTFDKSRLLYEALFKIWFSDYGEDSLTPINE